MRQSPTPPEKLSYGVLALLDWLCEAGEGRRMASVTGGLGGSGLTLMEVDPQAKRGLRYIHPGDDPILLDRLGGRVPTDLRPLSGYGLHRFQRSQREGSARGIARPEPDPVVDAVVERHGRDAFGYTDNVYLPSVETFRIWREAAADEARRRREARAEAEEATRRLVLVKARYAERNPLPPELAARLPPGFRFPFADRRDERPCALVEVRRETGSRLYVSRVERFRAGDGAFLEDPVTGREPNAYVDRDSVLYDGITREQAAEVERIYVRDAAERAESRAQLVREIEGTLLNWQRRQEQKDAERDDLLGEALGRAAAPGGPAR